MRFRVALVTLLASLVTAGSDVLHTRLPHISGVFAQLDYFLIADSPGFCEEQYQLAKSLTRFTKLKLRFCYSTADSEQHLFQSAIRNGKGRVALCG